MVTQILFASWCGLVAAQRLAELQNSRQNEVRLLARGGREHGRRHFALMRVVHAGWLASAVAEVCWLDRPFVPALAVSMLALFGVGQYLRLSARRALGSRWTVRVITLPGLPAVVSGPYRYVRHPNYLGVTLEIAALPLVHGAWLTALTFSLLDALLLGWRIRQEERALALDSDYDSRFAATPRFVPSLRRGGPP
jgi:methyltransferase